MTSTSEASSLPGFGLTNQIPIALSIETAGGQSTLELDSVQVTELNLKTSASSITISLPAQAGHTAVNIEASTASLLIRVPSNVAAIIRADKTLASTEIDLTRFPALVDGREYRSANYESAENRADIHMDISVGSVRIV